MIRYKTSAGILGICFVMVFFIWSSLSVYNTQKNQSEYADLTSGWDITGDIQYDNASLDNLAFQQMNTGNHFTCSTILPDKQITNPVLRIYTIHTAFRVYLDQELIYEYGVSRYESGKMIGYGYHMINLPWDFAGKHLKIDCEVTEDKAFTNLNVPRICNAVDTVRSIAVETSVAIAINMFLFIFGITLITASLVFTWKNHSFSKLLCIGFFSAGIAIWSFCNYDAIFLFSYDPLVKVYLEFLSIYVVPIPFMLYFYEDIHKKTNRLFIAFYDFIWIAQILFTALVFVLHFTNAVHMPKMIYTEHFILLILIIYMIGLSTYEIVKKQFAHAVLIVGMAIMLCTGFWDIVRYNLQKYFTIFQGYHYISVLCVGTLIFVFAQILDFVSEISQKICESVKTDTLEKMAYSDYLTGISNRRKCEEELEKLDSICDNYGIFSFDLNNLKYTNDTLGHAKGDEMICKFANILKDVFHDVAMVGRMGGDEFIAIVPDANRVDKDEIIQKLKIKIREERQKNNMLDLSTAYGYCTKKEYRDVDVKGIYRKADARMYDMKIEMKYRHSDSI